jgi:hypothetical protein
MFAEEMESNGNSIRVEARLPTTAAVNNELGPGQTPVSKSDRPW